MATEAKRIIIASHGTNRYLYDLQIPSLGICAYEIMLQGKYIK